MNLQRLRMLTLTAVAWASVTCRSDPLRQFAVTNELRVVTCRPGCPIPPPAGDTTPITSAARGDTVVVFLEVRNALFDSVEVVLRGACAENVAVIAGAGVVRQIPNPVTCPDSTLRRFVEPLSGDTERRFYRWIVDSGLVTGVYLLEGRMAIVPRIFPQIEFTVR
jgi:hypothetical protein